MCLDAIIEQYDKPSSVITDARKRFGGTDAKPTFENRTWNGTKEVPLDKWIKAESLGSTIPASNGGAYEPGFHVILDESDKKTRPKYGYAATLRRVYVRNIRTRGTESGDVVLVAQEMYVPSNPEAWPPLDEPKKTVGDRVKKLIGKTGNA